MAEYVTVFLEALICLAVAAAIRYAVPYIKMITESEKYSSLLEIVTIAVKAAEQTITESGQGKLKKAQVIAFVRGWLNERHITVTDAMLDRLIEAAVLTMKTELSQIGG